MENRSIPVNCISMLIFLLLMQFVASAMETQAADLTCDRLMKEARIQGREGKYEKALEMFNRVIENQSCADLKCDAYGERGKIEDGLNDLNGAVADYEKARQCRPASAEFKEALGNMYFKRGNFRERLGDLKGATGDYEKAMQQNPNLREAAVALSKIHYSRGRSEEKQGNLNRALESYKTALKLDADNHEASEALNNLEEKKRYKSQQRDSLFTF